MELNYNINCNDDLKQVLISFRNITLLLINSVEKQEFDDLEALFNDREVLIEKMNSMTYTKEVFANVCNELEIMPLEQKLSRLLNESKINIRMELDKIAASKRANRNYNKGFKVDSIFFHKQI